MPPKNEISALKAKRENETKELKAWLKKKKKVSYTDPTVWDDRLGKKKHVPNPYFSKKKLQKHYSKILGEFN